MTGAWLGVLAENPTMWESSLMAAIIGFVGAVVLSLAAWGIDAWRRGREKRNLLRLLVHDTATHVGAQLRGVLSGELVAKTIGNARPIADAAMLSRLAVLARDSKTVERIWDVRALADRVQTFLQGTHNTEHAPELADVLRESLQANEVDVRKAVREMFEAAASEGIARKEFREAEDQAMKAVGNLLGIPDADRAEARSASASSD